MVQIYLELQYSLSVILASNTHALWTTPTTPSKYTYRPQGRQPAFQQHATVVHRSSSSNPWSILQNSNPFAVVNRGGRNRVTRSSRVVVERNAGFLDDLFQGKLFDNSNKSNNAATSKRGSGDDEPSRGKDTIDDDSPLLSEMDFRTEVQKRSGEGTTSSSATTITTDARGSSSEGNTDDNNSEFDGYALRDAIYAKWGYNFDIDFQPVQSFGFKVLYLNVLPYRLGGRKFRHETELDYLCHLQAVVEILVKYDQLEYVLTQLEETNKKPRAGTVPIIAVPFRLDLTEEELNAILA